MTTTVTIKTHDWPAALTIYDNYERDTPTSKEYRHGSISEFIPANSERTIAVTDTRSINVRELPKEATSLDMDPFNQPPSEPNTASEG